MSTSSTNSAPTTEDVAALHKATEAPAKYRVDTAFSGLHTRQTPNQGTKVKGLHLCPFDFEYGDPNTPWWAIPTLKREAGIMDSEQSSESSLSDAESDEEIQATDSRPLKRMRMAEGEQEAGSSQPLAESHATEHRSSGNERILRPVHLTPQNLATITDEINLDSTSSQEQALISLDLSALHALDKYQRQGAIDQLSKPFKSAVRLLILKNFIFENLNIGDFSSLRGIDLGMPPPKTLTVRLAAKIINTISQQKRQGIRAFNLENLVLPMTGEWLTLSERVYPELNSLNLAGISFKNGQHSASALTMVANSLCVGTGGGKTRRPLFRALGLSRTSFVGENSASGLCAAICQAFPVKIYPKLELLDISGITFNGQTVSDAMLSETAEKLKAEWADMLNKLSMELSQMGEAHSQKRAQVSSAYGPTLDHEYLQKCAELERSIADITKEIGRPLHVVTQLAESATIDWLAAQWTTDPVPS